MGQGLIDSMSLEAYIGSGTGGRPGQALVLRPEAPAEAVADGLGGTGYKLYDLIGKSYDDPLWDSCSASSPTPRCAAPNRHGQLQHRRAEGHPASQDHGPRPRLHQL